MPHAAAVQRSSGRKRAAAFALLCIVQTSPGWAAKVYRCGNLFQDQPCPEPKAPAQRPAERTALPRDAAPCGAIPKEPSGRSDCVTRTASREMQAPGSVETRR